MKNPLSAVSPLILNYCKDLPQRTFEAGTAILKEGFKTNRLYILIDGAVEVRKDGVLLKATNETGAIFGEVSVLLEMPHMATVTTKVRSRFYEVMNAAEFVDVHPELGIVLAKVLAQRLAAISVHFSGAKLLFDAVMEQQGHVDEKKDNSNQPARVSPPPSHAPSQNAYDELERCIEERTCDLQREILERIRTETNLQNQFTRLCLLNQITGAVSGGQNFNSILRILLRQMESQLDIDFGAVLLLNSEKDSVSIAATQIGRQQSDPILKLQEGAVFTVTETGLADCLYGKTFYAKNTELVPARFFEFLPIIGQHNIEFAATL